MFLSVLIGTHNEGSYIETLLAELVNLRPVIPYEYEIVVVDDYSTDAITLNAFTTYADQIRLFHHALNDHYGDHKTYMNSVCRGEWILNLDADEQISRDFFMALKEFTDANPDYDAYALPRVNTVDGLTLSYVRRWGWNIVGRAEATRTEELPISNDMYAILQAYNLIDHETNTHITYKIPLVAWPDYQVRLYKMSDSVKWVGKVHEQLVGVQSLTALPPEFEYALWHHKTIARQEQQNSFYETLRGV